MKHLVDLFDLTPDRGLYRNDAGSLFQVLPPFSDLGFTAVDLGVPTRVRLARDGPSRIPTAGVDGGVQWSMPDPLGGGLRSVGPG